MDNNTGQNTSNIGGVTGKGFDVLGQPSPEIKKRGWDRKREAQDIMDLILSISKMTIAEIEDLEADFKLNPAKHTVLESKMLDYVRSRKATIDFLDRHISKAPIEVLNKNIIIPISEEDIEEVDKFFTSEEKPQEEKSLEEICGQEMKQLVEQSLPTTEQVSESLPEDIQTPINENEVNQTPN